MLLEESVRRGFRAEVDKREILWNAQLQEALAMVLGITRQMLSKDLKVLVEAGAVVLGYGRIEIVSAALLENVGGVA